MTIQFNSERITDHILRIGEGSGVWEYLIVGSEKALLIDTGYGIGDLRSYVESLTDKPLAVYITHGHVDHAAGAGQFDEVHISEYDLGLLERQCSLEFRKKIISHGMPDLDDSDFLPARTEPYLGISDKELIDLGGVHVLMIHVPGHTRGTFVPLVLEDRAVIFGDASGVGTLINLEHSTSVTEYLKSLKYLKSYESLYDLVLRQHGTCWSEKKLLDENIENCELIIAGKDAHIPTVSMGLECWWARERDPKTGMRTDGKEGNICYRVI